MDIKLGVLFAIAVVCGGSTRSFAKSRQTLFPEPTNSYLNGRVGQLVRERLKPKAFLAPQGGNNWGLFK